MPEFLVMRHMEFESRPPISGPVALIAGEEECARFVMELVHESDDSVSYTATQVMHPASFPPGYFNV